MSFVRILMGILMVASIVTTLVMWIIALIQAASREDLKNNKVLWIILIIFVSPIGPIIYFFVEGRKKYGWITLVAALATPIVLSVYAIQAFTSDQLQSAIQADSQNVIEVQLPTEN